MDEPICDTCKFYRTEENYGNGPSHHHVCKRFPPQAGGHPHVRYDDWCGEYRTTLKVKL